MPADSPHLNLCKTIMSSLALGYPAPTMLNWHGEFNRPDWHFGGSHIAKLESLLSILDGLLENEDEDGDRAGPNDLILLVDGYDIWFQLPPAVLIQRYHQMNAEADARNFQQWPSNCPIPAPKQRILVTPAKDCSPGHGSGSNPHYEHWPPSPVREDLYGEGTDTILPLWFDPARKHKKVRPRCVNSGFIMGTAEALRDAMERAKEKVEDIARNGRQIWSDQALLGEIIGDQEMWRTFMRETAKNWDDGGVHMPDLKDAEIRHIGEAGLQGVRFEFGIGLDYNFTTIPPTCSAEEDAYFVTLNDTEAIQSESVKAGVPGPVRVQAGPPPELTSLQFHQSDPLRNIVWSAIPLFTDFYFGNTPIGIHHNAYIDNLKSTRVKEWWSKMWFYPRLRELVTANMRAAHNERPLGKMGEGEKETVYWKSREAWQGVTVWNPSVNTEQGILGQFGKLSWDDVCQKGNKPWADVLFGDGKGPLVI
ncbi:hypothetical protein NLU13_3957 [Sarocladium strictum]|uniref:Uncharacterized protein n=1 Tax=Sarocladium strictum TaxID=5046 RepID=A0AA39GI01_SARSR|nr:hypothetical protein NLU13_3957 [Sarocladium strictum]